MRRLFLCLRLSYKNLWKNRRDYLPFLGASALIICLFFIVCNLSLSQGLGKNIPGGQTIQGLLTVGVLLLPVICIPFLWYINSFLMKHRRRELCLYGILGLERRHVGIVLFLESLYSYLLSLGAGLLAGTLLTKAAAWLLLCLAGLRADLPVEISPAALVHTAALFGFIFLGCLAGNLTHLFLSSPVHLLQDNRSGERDPHFGIIGLIWGLLFLGAGYSVAIWSYFHPELLLSGLIFPVFFLACLLTAIGTYGVFIFGSVYLLKGLKRCRSFYYRPKNFITVSGMLHRMRKNGMGLANICLFGTMTLVALSCVLAVALGQTEVLALVGTDIPTTSFSLNLRDISPESLILLFGSLAFLGVFFAAVFLLCTVLVMYYKQIAEGGEDRESFTVLRRVGMDDKMVRGTVKRQIMLVFLLPLAGTIVHLAFASPVLTRLFQVLRIQSQTVLSAAGLSVLIFFLLYLGAYFITANAYYRIVSR